MSADFSTNGSIHRPKYVCKCSDKTECDAQDWCPDCKSRPVRVEPVLVVKEEDRPEMIS